MFEPETSAALGFGFRCGFLGLLHMEIIQERIEREFQLDIITTAPSVSYLVKKTNGEEEYISNPTNYPDPAEIAETQEPYVKADIIAPEEFAASLRLLKAKQDVVAIELSDPADEKFILKNPVTFEDAETGEIVEYSGNIAEINAALNAVQEEKSAVCRRAGVDLIKVDCGGDILKPLIGFFSERQKRIR